MPARRTVGGRANTVPPSGPIMPTQSQQDILGANGAPKVAAEPISSTFIPPGTKMSNHFSPDMNAVSRGGASKLTPDVFDATLLERIVSGAEATVTDKSYVTQEDRIRYGIADHEVPCWIRPPRWENGVESDRPGEFLNENFGHSGGARIIKHEGNYVGLGGDLILAVKHVDVVLAIQKRNENMAEQFAQKANDDYSDDLYHGPDGQVLDINNQKDLHRLKKANMEAISMMMQGSDTKGLTLDEAVSRKTLEEIQSFSARSALSGSTRTKIADVVDKVIETGKSVAKGKGGTFNMGAHLKDGVLVRS